MKLASPLYVAVIALCTPTASEAIVMKAWPLAFKLPTPIELPLSKKVAVPVGVPAPPPLIVTVAVNVTVCPKTEGFGAEVTLVVVPARLTVCA